MGGGSSGGGVGGGGGGGPGGGGPGGRGLKASQKPSQRDHDSKSENEDHSAEFKKARTSYLEHVEIVKKYV